MGLFREFREFAMKGSVLDLAVGVIIGAAFGAVVNSFVKDVMMPPLGYVSGGIDFSQHKLVIKSASADAAGKVAPEVAVSYGAFINAVIQFLIQAFCVFMIIKMFNTARKRFEAEKPAAAPPGPTLDQKLLGEIRDLLSKRA